MGDVNQVLPKRRQTAPLERLRPVFESAIQKADEEIQSFHDQNFPPANSENLPVGDIRPRLKELRILRHNVASSLEDLMGALGQGHPKESSDADKETKRIINL